MQRDPPAWLSADARAVWDQIDAAIRDTAEPDALAVYCCAVADYQQAQRLLDQSGPLIRNQRGAMVRNPLNIVKSDNAQVIRQLGRQLGIVTTPTRPTEAATAGYRNRAAVERTITALRAGGRVEEVDAAAAALARHLATALDMVDPARYPAQTASLARSQLAALRVLRGLDDDQTSGGVDELLAYLSAPLGDSPQP
jgi:P27 family predicted phage terminase small subunit